MSPTKEFRLRRPLDSVFVILFTAPPCLATSPQMPASDMCSCSAGGIFVATAPLTPLRAPKYKKTGTEHGQDSNPMPQGGGNDRCPPSHLVLKKIWFVKFFKCYFFRLICKKNQMCVIACDIISQNENGLK